MPTKLIITYTLYPTTHLMNRNFKLSKSEDNCTAPDAGRLQAKPHQRTRKYILSLDLSTCVITNKCPLRLQSPTSILQVTTNLGNIW